MTEKPSILLILLRATIVFGPAVLWLGLFFALETRPESPWMRVWRFAFASLSLAALFVFSVTRSRKKRLAGNQQTRPLQDNQNEDETE